LGDGQSREATTTKTTAGVRLVLGAVMGESIKLNPILKSQIPTSKESQIAKAKSNLKSKIITN